jgi:hypothetical protein
MATYKDVQRFVKEKSGFVPETCWIAHVLELNCASPRLAPNRIDPRRRENPCPPDRRPAIERALRQLGLLPLGRLPPQPREDANQATFRVVGKLTKDK